MKNRTLVSLIGLLALRGGVSMVLAQGTAFTYQGQLLNDGNSVSSGTLANSIDKR